MKVTAARHMKDVMVELKLEGIYLGYPDEILEAANRAGIPDMHPMDRIARVLRSVRSSPLFFQDGHIPAHDSRARQRRLAYFKLKPQVLAEEAADAGRN